MTTNTNSVHRNLVVVVKNRSKRIGYFGPAGTFTEQALLTQNDLAECELVAYRTVPDVLDAVESGEVEQGFVPIENSIAVFTAVRAGSLDIIKRLKPEQLELTGTHTEAGEYSLKRWLETYTRHANNHADQIKQNLA